MVEHVECNKEKEIEDIGDGVKEILKLLNGNGKVGICAKVNILWASTALMVVTVVGLLAKVVLASIAGS